MKKVIKKPVSKEVHLEGKVDKLVKPVTIVQGECRLGLALGATVNLGDFQSARIDAWIERVVPDNKKDIDKAYKELSSILEEVLEEQQEGLKS